MIRVLGYIGMGMIFLLLLVTAPVWIYAMYRFTNMHS